MDEKCTGNIFLQRKTHTTHGECSQQCHAVSRLCPELLNDFIFYWHIELFFPHQKWLQISGLQARKIFLLYESICCKDIFKSGIGPLWWEIASLMLQPEFKHQSWEYDLSILSKGSHSLDFTFSVKTSTAWTHLPNTAGDGVEVIFCHVKDLAPEEGVYLWHFRKHQTSESGMRPVGSFHRFSFILFPINFNTFSINFSIHFFPTQEMFMPFQVTWNNWSGGR